MSIRVSLLTALAAWSSVAVTGVAATNSPPKVADIVFPNGTIYAVNADFRKVSAVAVKDGYIKAIGSDGCVEHWVGPSTNVVNLHGHMVMPGLVDAHMHVLSGGQFLLKCNLEYQTLPIEAILEHVQDCLDTDRKGDDEWLEVVNMDYPGLITKSGHVNKLDLDRLNTTRPVMIRSSDYHTVFTNSRALEPSDITADTPNPSNGVIERLPGSLEPSGVLQGDAYNLLAGPPPLSFEENVEATRAALKLLREAGITTFQDAAAGPEHQTVFGAANNEGGLSSRAYFDYRIEAPKSIDDVAAVVADAMSAITSMNDASAIRPRPTLKWQAIKAFIDGVITYPALTAAVVEPYWLPVPGSSPVIWAPDNSTMVDPYWKPAILAKTLELLFLQSIDAQLHADGDLAVKVAWKLLRASRESILIKASALVSPTTRSPRPPTGPASPLSALMPL